MFSFLVFLFMVFLFFNGDLFVIMIRIFFVFLCVFDWNNFLVFSSVFFKVGFFCCICIWLIVVSQFFKIVKFVWKLNILLVLLMYVIKVYWMLFILYFLMISLIVFLILVKVFIVLRVVVLMVNFRLIFFVIIEFK